MASLIIDKINPQADSPPHGGTDADEVEYDRLRSLAREEAQKRGRCFDRSRAAYAGGDRAAAHQLSEEGKRHGTQMDAYNAQARDFIFSANNAHRPEDTIDLHRLHIKEAEKIMETRLEAARQRGDPHLNIIVGKGNHSAGGVTKIKPAIEKLLKARGLQFNSERNVGRIFVQLKEGGETGEGSGGNGGQKPQQSYQQGGRYQKHHKQQPQQQKPQKPQQPQKLEQPQQPQQPEQPQHQQQLQQYLQNMEQQKYLQNLQRQQYLESLRQQQQKLQQERQQKLQQEQQQKLQQQQQQKLQRQQQQKLQQQQQQQYLQSQQQYSQYQQQQYPQYQQQQYPQYQQQQQQQQGQEQKPVSFIRKLLGCCIIM